MSAKNKQDLANYIRNRTGRSPVLKNGHSLRKADLTAVADELGIDYSDDDTKPEVGVKVLIEVGVFGENSDPVDWPGSLTRYHLSKIIDALNDDS